MKTYQLLLIFFLAFNASNAQIQIGQDIVGGPAWGTGEYAGYSVEISNNGKRVVVGYPRSQMTAGTHGPGFVRVFQEINGQWIQIGSDIFGEAPDDFSGSRVAISSDGRIIAIGARYNSGNGGHSGHVRVYKENQGSWIQIGQDIDGEHPQDLSGWGISISSDGARVVIGAAENQDAGFLAGHARVYENTNGNWTQIGQDIDGEASKDASGYDVAISGDGGTVAIGARGNDGNGPESGHVRVFKENQGNWMQIGVDLDGEASSDGFGEDVSLSFDGKRVAIGANCNSGNGPHAGHVRIYENINGNWIQIGQDIDGLFANDNAGESVAISADGSKVILGAPGDGVNQSAARVYKEVNGLWEQIGGDIIGPIIQHANGNGHDVSFSADGNRAIVGYSFENNAEGLVKIYSLKGVFGRIYLDNNGICSLETQVGLNQIPLQIQPGNIIAHTRQDGYWELDLPVGTYSMTVDTSMHWLTSCLPQSFTVVDTNGITNAPSIGLKAKNPCPAPDVSIYMPFMRRCFTDQVIRVKACNTNQGTGPLHNGMVIVTLDSFLIPTSFELPVIYLGNNQYQFDFDTLIAGQCLDFWIKATIDCSVQLGEGLCMQAEIFPILPCMLDNLPKYFPTTVPPCNGSWDESSLAVYSYCQNDSIFFEVKNQGIGAMTCYHPITVYTDGILSFTDSVQLNTQQAIVYAFSGNGASWHLKVPQHPHHPGNSNPNATIENCGNTTAQTQINSFPLDDADPVIDIYCGEVTGSYDPNDKTGYPLGVTSDNHIDPNQQLQYVIRFQNTGTDTAFTVVIRDTLDTDLDIFSVRSGVSSHDYEFRMYGPRVLEWTFNDIMLPDSNVNEPGSHGFVQFTVDQLPFLVDGTQITNSAAIYFDFNAPIITNVSQHEVYYEFPIYSNVEQVISPKQFTLFPNPNNGQFYIDLKQNYGKVNLMVTDIAGRLIQEREYHNVVGIPLVINNKKGVYFVKVETDKSTSEVMKVLIH